MRVDWLRGAVVAGAGALTVLAGCGSGSGSGAARNPAAGADARATVGVEASCVGPVLTAAPSVARPGQELHVTGSWSTAAARTLW